MADLKYLKQAQQGNIRGYPSFRKAKEEIANGKKVGHWIWYIFPQLKVLGFSKTSKTFGISSFDEACDYLRDPELFENYYDIARVVLEQLNAGVKVEMLMGGGGDARKLVSSLTLFHGAAVALDHKELAQCCTQLLKKIGYPTCDVSRLAADSSPKQHPKVTEIPSIENQTPVEAKAPIQTITNDFSELSAKLGEYIKKREDEWNFHYNFLGIMSVIYWIYDACNGTDYYNNKSREVKISAATHVKDMIDNKASINLSDAEVEALCHDRLGELVQGSGGLEKIQEKVMEDSDKSAERTISL